MKYLSLNNQLWRINIQYQWRNEIMAKWRNNNGVAISVMAA
jgi:hypothetical protein